MYYFELFPGYISITDWCNVMEETTHLGLPWRMLKDKLVRTDIDTRRVRYMDTFDLNVNVRIQNRILFEKNIFEDVILNIYVCFSEKWKEN